MATAVTERQTRGPVTENILAPLAVPNLTAQQLDGINLLLTVEHESHNGVTQRKLQVLAEETVRDLKIQLRKKEFFTNQHCLVFGHRELMEDEIIGQVAASSGGGKYLHVLAKLSDIGRLEVTTDKQKRILKNDRNSSALTDSFRHSSFMTSMMPSSPLLLRGRVMETDEQTLNATEGATMNDNSGLESSHGDLVVHLVIHKSSKVHWHHLKGEGFELRITADATVDDVKQKLAEVAEGFEAKDHAVVKAGHRLQPCMSLSELGVQKGDVLEVVEVPLCLEEYPDPTSPTRMSPKIEMPEEWQRAKDALAQGILPKLTSVGTGGSYFISAMEGKNLAVFKPEDEEPRAPNNPKGHRVSLTGEGLRKGVRPGEGATREVIAFTLDHEHFSGVPPTAMASLSSDPGHASHRKVGSFQQFVQHDVDCEEMGPSNFPVQEVHKICVLDIRLGNTDRNAGNILASRKRGQWILTPIDHGYCLPDSFEDISFEWMYWRQAKIPFRQETKEYIARLDANDDLALLERSGLYLRPDCVRVFRVCTMLLKKSLSHEMTPYDLGRIMCRQGSSMSPLEKLHKGAMNLTLGQMYGGNFAYGTEHLEMDEELYLKMMSDVIDQYLDETADVS